MRIAIVVLGILGIVTTALPLLRLDSWWVRIFDFPRLQITLVLAATLVVYFFFGWSNGVTANLFLVALIASLAHQSHMMFPYTVLAGKQVEASTGRDPNSMCSLMFANVLQTNRNAGKLLEIISDADPDIFLAVETDKWWSGRLSSLSQTYKYSVIQAQENTYGMILYSKLEIVDPIVHFLVEDEVPSIHCKVRLHSGQHVELRCLHPPPPFPTEDKRSTERDVELLIVGKEVKKSPLPVVVVGDLNDVAWSRTNYLFQAISGLLDPRVGRGFFHTFHANYPWLRFPLDHCFHSNHFRLVDFRRLSYYGSDHFPVYIKLSHEHDAADEQDELSSDRKQDRDAGEKIAERLSEDESQITPEAS